MKVADGLGIALGCRRWSIARSTSSRRTSQKPAPRQVQWLPAWSAGQAFSVKVLTEYGRNQDSNITRLAGMVDRLPIFALSYLADAMATTPARPALRRRRAAASRTRCASRATARTSRRSTPDALRVAVELERARRRRSCSTASCGAATIRVLRAAAGARWLLARARTAAGRTRRRTPRRSSRSSPTTRSSKRSVPDMTATVALGTQPIGTATFRGRSSARRSTCGWRCPTCCVQSRRAPNAISRSRAPARAGCSTPRGCSTCPATPPPSSDQGIRVERRYERFVENGIGAGGDRFRRRRSGPRHADDHAAEGAPVRRGHRCARRPAFEAVDSWFRTTAADLARDASVQTSRRSWEDLVARAAASTMSRSTTTASRSSRRGWAKAGTSSRISCARRRPARSSVAGTSAEEMYAPEVNGRSRRQ